MQTTITLKRDRRDREQLRETLTTAGFEFRDLQYAFWQARGDGCVVSFYRSGKLVLQGPRAETTAALLGADAALSKKATPAGTNARATTKRPALRGPYGAALAKLPDPPPSAWIGIDEAGKGDYFGPLVVAAARVTPDDLPLLQELGVGDSKRIPDSRILEIDPGLRAALPHSIIAPAPEKYNELYASFGNLNLLLAWAHARSAENVLENSDAELILSDQFSKRALVQEALFEIGRTKRYFQRTRAEDDPAVAAASVMARAEFVRSIHRLSRQYGIKLALGAGAPVLAAGRRFVQKHGGQALSEVAKVHFKTTHKLV